MLLQVHDELLFEVPEAQVEETTAVVREVKTHGEETMRRFITLALVLGLLAAVPATAAEPELAAANKLFVQAIGLAETAEATKNSERRAALFDEARGLLARIVAEHPESHLALLLATGQQVGGLSLPLAEARAELARLQAVNLDQVLVELEAKRAAETALRAQTASMRAALGRKRPASPSCWSSRTRCAPGFSRGRASPAPRRSPACRPRTPRSTP